MITCSGVGTVESDIKVLTLESGTKVASFRVKAIEEIETKNGTESTLFFFANVEVWGGAASYIESRLRTGDEFVILRGVMRTNSWTPTNGGDKVYKNVIRVEKFRIIRKNV